MSSTVAIALDPASSEFYDSDKNRYVFKKSDGRELSSEEMADYWVEWTKKFPIISIEDGMAEDDWDGWKALTDKAGGSLQLVGDDLFVTNTKRLSKGIDLGVANVASQLGLLQYGQNNYGEAERLYLEALEVFKKKEDAEGEATVLSNLGTLYFQTQQIDKAQEEFEKALTLLRKMGHPMGWASVLKNLSYVYEKQKEFAKAHDGLKEAREIFDKLKMPQEVDDIDRHLAVLDEQAGESLESMRAELFPGLSDGSGESKKAKKKIGRNDSCSCGSGKKYKKCCGA